MAFPTVVSRSTFGDSSATTSRAVTLPASIVANNLLLLFVALGATALSVTTPAGWTPLSGYAQTAHTPSTAAFFKTATGSEGATVTVASTSGKLSAVCYQISGWSGTPEAATALSGSNSAVPNPPSLTPSWGALDNLYIAIGHMSTGTTLTSSPTNYTNGQIGAAASGGSPSSTASAERQITGSPEDPGTFTLGSSASWVAATVAVQPVASAAVTYPQLERGVRGAFRGLHLGGR